MSFSIISVSPLKVVSRFTTEDDTSLIVEVSLSVDKKKVEVSLFICEEDRDVLLFFKSVPARPGFIENGTNVSNLNLVAFTSLDLSRLIINICPVHYDVCGPQGFGSLLFNSDDDGINLDVLTADDSSLYKSKIAGLGMEEAPVAIAPSSITAELYACLLDVLDANGNPDDMDFNRYRAAIKKYESSPSTI